jgi:aspartokinase/homoserine dehydrogenase 1
VGLLDRSGYVFDPRGLSRRRLLKLARARTAAPRGQLGGVKSGADAALAHIASHAVTRPVVVDVTAEETGDLLLKAAGQGFDLVLANKKPLAGPYEDYSRLLTGSSARAGGCASRPRRRGHADPRHPPQARGQRRPRPARRRCLSGTLGYVLSAVTDGKAFSAAVREAVALGYAEPDPRDDLSGATPRERASSSAGCSAMPALLPTPRTWSPPRCARCPSPSSWRASPARMPTGAGASSRRSGTAASCATSSRRLRAG